MGATFGYVKTKITRLGFFFEILQTSVSTQHLSQRVRLRFFSFVFLINCTDVYMGGSVSFDHHIQFYR